VSTEQREFCELVIELRALGAVRVRHGALEVAFAGPIAVEQPKPTHDAPHVSEDELVELVKIRRLAEEIP
jgi:hypothetical protein